MAAILVRRLKNICVFSRSNLGHTLNFVEVTKNLRKVLCVWKMHLKYGGGDIGLTESVLQATNTRGSQILGIISKALTREIIIRKRKREEAIAIGTHKWLIAMIEYVVFLLLY